jgi:hypothetical protein
MDIITFPDHGTAKQLSLLVSHRLKSFSLTFLSLIYREPRTIKFTNVPIAVFDLWAQRHQDSPVRAQFTGRNLVVTRPSSLHAGTAAWIAQHIRDTVRAMCPARDARVSAHGGRTSPLEF